MEKEMPKTFQKIVRSIWLSHNHEIIV
jgi:hypothetical protein